MRLGEYDSVERHFVQPRLASGDFHLLSVCAPESKDTKLSEWTSREVERVCSDLLRTSVNFREYFVKELREQCGGRVTSTMMSSDSIRVILQVL